MTYKEVDGDLIELAKAGEFDIIAHGCNCFCTMGAGIAPQMAAAFGCDQFFEEDQLLRGDMSKLGNLSFRTYYTTDGKPPVTVVNAYTQYGLGRQSNGEPALDYAALVMCLKKINYISKRLGSKVGLPQIGAGLAGGNWETIKSLIKEHLTECDVTVVIFKKNNYKLKEDVSDIKN